VFPEFRKGELPAFRCRMNKTLKRQSPESFMGLIILSATQRRDLSGSGSGRLRLRLGLEFWLKK
jgi:hypothetical protein